MSILGHPGMKTVDIHYKRITPLINGEARKTLEDLSLDPDIYHIFTSPASAVVGVRCGTYRTRLPLTLLLPKDEMEVARQVLGNKVAGKAVRL